MSEEGGDLFRDQVGGRYSLPCIINTDKTSKSGRGVDFTEAETKPDQLIQTIKASEWNTSSALLKAKPLNFDGVIVVDPDTIGDQSGQKLASFLEKIQLKLKGYKVVIDDATHKTKLLPLAREGTRLVVRQQREEDSEEPSDLLKVGVKAVITHVRSGKETVIHSKTNGNHDVEIRSTDTKKTPPFKNFALIASVLAIANNKLAEPAPNEVIAALALVLAKRGNSGKKRQSIGLNDNEVAAFEGLKVQQVGTNRANTSGIRRWTY